MSAGRPLIAVFLAVVVVAGCSPKPGAEPALGSGSAQTRSSSPSPSSSSSSTPPSTPPTWQLAELATEPTSVLHDVAAAGATNAWAADDVWAAGNGAWSGFLGPLLFHWDGATWQAVQVGVNQQGLALQAIDGRSATDLWAVGDTLAQGGGTLAVRGDGTTWNVVTGLPNKFLPGVAVDTGGNP